MQNPENESLTKTDHTKFEPEDYEKLNNILRDTASILKTLKQEDLIVIPDSINPYKAYEVDGYTAATQPALAEVVVKDAVYTWLSYASYLRSLWFYILIQHALIAGP